MVQGEAEETGQYMSVLALEGIIKAWELFPKSLKAPAFSLCNWDNAV